MKIRIHAELDGSDPEKLNYQWRKLHEYVEEKRKEAKARGSDAVGISNDFRKFADPTKHNERPEPLEG